VRALGAAGMSEIITTSAITLDALALQIRHEVDRAEADFKTAVGHAIHAGELLIEAKDRVGHGGWLPWLQENFPGTVQTAAGYMRMARHRTEIEDASSIRGALAELARPVDPPTEDAIASVVEQPDRCERCARTVRADRPHECREASRRLDDAYEALSSAYRDIDRYPRSEVDCGRCLERVEACARLVDQLRGRLNGEPVPDEQQQCLDSTERAIEGVGFAICECGSRLADYQGRPYCYGCKRYRDGDR
jgi:hypothetical protein